MHVQTHGRAAVCKIRYYRMPKVRFAVAVERQLIKNYLKHTPIRIINQN